MGESMTKNRYYIGPVDNFGYMTRYPFAMTDIVNDRWQQYEAPVNVHYAEHLKAMILRPDPALRNLALSGHSFHTSNVWEVCRPRDTGADHLYMSRATANYANSCTSAYLLPATPSLTLSLVRADAPEGMLRSAQRWSFGFGGGYSLTFGGNSAPLLQHGSLDVATLQVQDSDRQGYDNDNHMRIEIHNLLGRLYIIGLSREPWIIPDVGDIPAASWSIVGNGGVYAVNVSRYIFATSGTFETPWIEHFSDYSAVTPTYRALPAAQAGTTATVSIAATSGSRRKYRVTLTGPGTTTPVLQLFSAVYLPTYHTPSPTWTEITPWVMDASESKPQELTTSTVDMTLSLHKVENGQTLQEAVGDLNGQYAFYHTTGTREGAESLRFTGIVKVRSAQNAKAETISLKAVDRFVMLSERKLLFAPCVAGLPIATALSWYAQWAGFRTADIVVNIPGTLEVDADGYHQPPYLPANGVSAAEMIESIRKAGSFNLACDENGVLLAWATDDTTEYGPFTTAPDTAGSVALSEVEYTADLSDVPNTIMVEGRAPDGSPLYAIGFDEEAIITPGTDNFSGYPVVEYIVNADLTTPEAVNAACSAAFRERKPARKVKITSGHPDSLLCYLWPRNYIRVYDERTGMGERLFKITGVSTDFGKTRNLTTIDAEEIPNA
jgi:hypothetical protein